MLLLQKETLETLEFFKASWANIAEREAVEALLLKELEQPMHDETLQNPPFQLVTNKRKTKTQKTTSSKPLYQTRSKVSNPKPFR